MGIAQDVVANDHIDFDIKAGEIHGVLWENGAVGPGPDSCRRTRNRHEATTSVGALIKVRGKWVYGFKFEPVMQKK